MSPSPWLGRTSGGSVSTGSSVPGSSSFMSMVPVGEGMLRTSEVFSSGSLVMRGTEIAPLVRAGPLFKGFVGRIIGKDTLTLPPGEKGKVVLIEGGLAQSGSPPALPGLPIPSEPGLVVLNPGCLINPGRWAWPGWFRHGRARTTSANPMA